MSEIHVLAATSLSAEIRQLADEFEADNECRIVVVSGSSNSLAQQILAGAPADVFIPAHREWLESLISGGKELGWDRVLATNRLVLVARKGNPLGIESVEGLIEEKVTRIAVGGNNVPVGEYARQFLDSSRLLQPLLAQSQKVVPAPNAATIVTWLSRGEVDAAFVYASDVADEFHVVAEVPSSSHDPIEYSAVHLMNPATDESVVAFLEYLASDRAKELFRSSGFTARLPVAGTGSGN